MLDRFKKLALNAISITTPETKEPEEIKPSSYHPVNILRSLEDKLRQAPDFVSAIIPTTSLFDLGSFAAQAVIQSTASLPGASPLIQGKISSLKNSFYTYLASPERPLKETRFEQSELVAHINKLFPDIRLNPKGVCFGLMMTWYAYRNTNKNLLAELNPIMQSSFLDAEQIKLLTTIQATQEKYQEDLCELPELKTTIQRDNVSVFPLKRNADFANDVDNIVTEIVHLAISHQDSLIEIQLNNERKAHAIGVIAQETTFKYFDPNCREATFSNMETAKQSIINLLKYKYQAYFAVEDNSVGQPPIRHPGIRITIYHSLPTAQCRLSPICS